MEPIEILLMTREGNAKEKFMIPVKSMEAIFPAGDPPSSYVPTATIDIREIEVSAEFDADNENAATCIQYMARARKEDEWNKYARFLYYLMSSAKMTGIHTRSQP